MYCTKCGYQNNNDVQFCIKCGQPMQANVTPDAHVSYMPRKPKRGLTIIMSISAVLLLAALVLVLISSSPVVGRWYAQSGAELIMLKNGKGMTVIDQPGEVRRVHFMYVIEYQEPGYIEGETYEKESGTSAWFYLYDGVLEMNGECFYRQKPS